MRPLVAEIDLAALIHNFSVAQTAAPNSKNFAVVKANAYGHGAVQCADALADYADGFAVASVEEAVELRRAGINHPMLVLSAFTRSDEVELLVHYKLIPVIHSLYQLQQLEQYKIPKLPVSCWLKIDTGMSRLGLNDTELTMALANATASDAIKVVGIMSHFASSDETLNNFTQTQIENFLRLTAQIDLPFSLANSCAIMAWPDSHRNWNRPGIMLYGTSSIDIKSEMNLKPVMRFHSQLISTRTLSKGESVGYGQAFVAEHDMKIGVVACGYADGYPRSMPTGGPVIIKGTRSRILGRVSMDSLSVDLTETQDAKVGDLVELWGERLSVREVADAAKTIPYELLTRVSKRVPREYKAYGE